MRLKSKKISVVLLLLFVLAVSNTVIAKTNDMIKFKDNNLQKALSKYYELDSDIITKEKASELTKKDDLLVLENANIFDLEGLQYFINMITLYIGGNNLQNLKPLSMLNKLGMLDITDNAIKGIKLEKALSEMGKIENLDKLILENNQITNVDFLKKVGNMKNYTHLDLSNNRIRDISILKNATNLTSLDLSDNRIADVTPLKDLKNLKYWLSLQDNCIIDYKPIKHILDKIYEDEVISRYDYYINPVDVGINGKTIEFPYLTVYYKYQPYVEAIPLLKALGGSAKYNKKSGTLTCTYGENVLVMKDFSKSYTLNGVKKSMKYPMRRMQYDLAYVPVKDICKALGLSFSVTKNRKFFENEDEFINAPKYIEIIKPEKELG